VTQGTGPPEQIPGVILAGMSLSPITPQQQELDRAIRASIRADGRITHALAYGSFTQGTADAWSDLEYYVFLPDPEVGHFDVRAWLDTLAPVRHFVQNDFGTPNAVLEGLLRVELHAEPESRLEGVLTWPAFHIHPERMLVKDTDGQLADVLTRLAAKARPNPAAETQLILARLLNGLVFGLNVLARGERIRAHELLGWVQGGLLRLARLAEGQTEHWLTASRCAERELGPEALERYARLTGRLNELEQLYAEAWSWTRELAAEVHSPPLDPGLAGDIQARVTALLEAQAPLTLRRDR